MGMTTTERLRALLDERGVEWDYGITGPTTTRFRVNGANGVDLTFTPMRDGLLCSTILTPEQAIVATLGSCNCSNSERTSDSDATAERRGDAVEVVRCRDCACFSVDDSDHDYRTGWWCKRWYTDMVMPDGFCAWASRKESE